MIYLPGNNQINKMSEKQYPTGNNYEDLSHFNLHGKKKKKQETKRFSPLPLVEKCSMILLEIIAYRQNKILFVLTQSIAVMLKEEGQDPKSQYIWTHSPWGRDNPLHIK